MAASWPKDRRLLGKEHQRLDGPAKSTGRAKYSYDINRPGMLHAVILRCPHPRARVVSIDTSAAEKMPGVRAVHLLTEAGRELSFAGEEVAAVAADTEALARDAARAIKVEYDASLEFVVDERQALKDPEKKTVAGPARSNVGKTSSFTKGDVEKGFQEAEAVAEGSYGAAVICHQCLEPHGLVAEWDKDGNLTVWASTQATTGTAGQLAQHFNIPPTKVKCVTHYMGGGFGSKFGPDVQGIAAAELAKKAGKPVKLMLDREAEITAAGNRPSVYGTVKIGGKKDGTITAYQVSCYGTPGYRGGATVNFGLLPYVYGDVVENVKREHTVVFVNAGGARAMRAPGHPQNCILTDCPVDDLAAKLGIDPLVIRRKNIPPNDPKAAESDPNSWPALRHTIYSQELDIAAKLAGWAEKWHPPGQGPRKRGMRHGIGMALHTWGGFASGAPNECTVRIGRDGSVTALSSTQDLGTGQRTVTAIVVAEVLGLSPADVITQVGESDLGRSSGSGGSTTCPSQAPAALLAATAARDDLFAKVGKKLGADPANLKVEEGKVTDTRGGKSWSWKEFCARLGTEEARGTGEWSAGIARKPDTPQLSSGQVGGVQVVELWVDDETGVVRLEHIVAVQDCGLVVNKLTCESQVAGGVIMGLNYALFEERILDPQTGRQTNADMEFYKLANITDVPKITVHMLDMPQRGVIGIGEPPTVSTAAAVGNAIFNAIGVRVPYAPYTPERVLEALAKGGNV